MIVTSTRWRCDTQGCTDEFYVEGRTRVTRDGSSGDNSLMGGKVPTGWGLFYDEALGRERHFCPRHMEAARK